MAVVGVPEVEKVILLEPRGFCAGVESAVKALAWMVGLYDRPVYCYHHIVHNEAVIERFRRLGVVFVDSIDEVPAGAPLMLSAHGVTPRVLADARARTTLLVDAVCPLVAKVHHEIERRADEGYTIVYVGHAGHDEAVAAEARAPGRVHVVATPEQVAGVEPGGRPVALLAQTTLAREEWTGVAAAVRDRFGAVWTPPVEDICYATTNRQEALRSVAGRCDATIVVGSATSANTGALVRTARSAGCRQVWRVDVPGQLPAGLAGVVAVTAGASVPESSVAAVVAALRPRHGVERWRTVEETEYLPLPPALRRLLHEHQLAGGLPPTRLPADDRTTTAEELLTALEATGLLAPGPVGVR
jgi:4-hydroxy-3-methylbut-2-enyl diphosphate reductase